MTHGASRGLGLALAITAAHWGADLFLRATGLGLFGTELARRQRSNIPTS